MLFTREFLDGIASGEVTLAYRRWQRARVRVGSRLRTAAGVLAVDAVDQVTAGQITDTDARAAGYPDRDTLLAVLDRYGPGLVYRITLHREGDDPRIALRQRADLTDTETAHLRARLDRLDRASRRGPWTATVLRLIARRPGVRAADLAAGQGRDTQAFKTDVRKLKELGLTESLEIGYRLSPRGEALLRVL